MSYFVARKVAQGDGGETIGITLPEIDTTDRQANVLDMNMDDEVLPFVLGLIEQVDELAEGEALVVWKEIF